MKPQRYYVGDTVRVRPFSEIDTDDLGSVSITEREVFFLGKSLIDSLSSLGFMFTIREAEKRRGTYIYRLSPLEKTDAIYDWAYAQGMLEGLELEEVVGVDAESLFSELFSS